MDKILERAIIGGVSGFLGAIAVDYDAFKSFQKAEEFARYDWAIAGKRWIYGFLVGAVGGAMTGDR